MGRPCPLKSEDERTGLLKPVQTNCLVSSIHVYFSVRSSTSTTSTLMPRRREGAYLSRAGSSPSPEASGSDSDPSDIVLPAIVLVADILVVERAGVIEELGRHPSFCSSEHSSVVIRHSKLRRWPVTSMRKVSLGQLEIRVGRRAVADHSRASNTLSSAAARTDRSNV